MIRLKKKSQIHPLDKLSSEEKALEGKGVNQEIQISSVDFEEWKDIGTQMSFWETELCPTKLDRVKSKALELTVKNVKHLDPESGPFVRGETNLTFLPHTSSFVSNDSKQKEMFREIEREGEEEKISSP